MTSPTGRRTHGHARRTRRVRRASARLSPIRAGAILAMLASAAAISVVAASDAFAYRELEISGAHYTDEATIRAALDLEPGTNLFGLSTRTLNDRLSTLPTIAGASITIGLPDRVRVVVTEREPILVWQVGGRRHLVDAAGLLFGEVLDDASPGAIAAAELPVIVDGRAADAGLGVGDFLHGMDFDAATRIGSLVPVDVGSSASRLVVELTDADGFVVRPLPAGWTAVFGFYTPKLRTPAMIPAQVQLLASLLADREAQVERVTLATETGGAVLLRPTEKPKPKASTKPTPRLTPRPTTGRTPAPSPTVAP